jgi:hypothetical protein
MSTLFLAEATNPVQSMIDFLLRGGLFMWPLLICSRCGGKTCSRS